MSLTIYSSVPLGKEIDQMRICVLRAINRTDTSATEFETDCAVDARISITPNDVLTGMVTYSFKKEATDLSVTVKVIVNGYLGELQTATGEGVFAFLADTPYASGKLTLTRTAPVESDAGRDAGHDAGGDVGPDASHHPPVCADLDFSVFENGTLTEQLAATPSDATPFAYEIVAQPDYGAITDLNDETGVFIYQPTTSFTGSDAFTYKACDAYDCSNTATVTITVAPIPAISFLNGSSTHSQYQGGEVDIPVTLSFAAPGGVSVGYRLNGTAVIGDDYTDDTSPPGILSFSPGQTTQNISLHVVAHPDPTEDLTVLITLENLTGQAKRGTPATHTLTLIADVPSREWKYVGPRPASQPSKKIAFNSQESTNYIQLTSFNSNLYMIWQENSYSPSGLAAYKTRAKVFNGSENNPEGAFIDGGGYNGLNFNPGDGAYYPKSYCFNGTLYAVWNELKSNINQIRVKAYNGDDSWIWIDGGGFNGLNFNPDKDASNDYLFEFDSRLFLTWSEPNTAYISQIRVMAYDEGDHSWTFVDGAEDEGINFDPAHQAINPVLIELYSKLYAAWQERNGKGIYQIRIKEFNGDIENPEWTAALHSGGLNGLNFDGTEYAETPQLQVLDDKVYAAWAEGWASTGAKQLLVYVWK